MAQEILSSWLAQLCAMLPGVQQAYVVSGPSDGLASALASFPGDMSFKPADHWQSLAAAAAQQRAPLVSMVENAEKPHLRIAYPLDSVNDAQALLLCELSASASQQQAILQILAWGKAWLKLMQSLHRDSAQRDSAVPGASSPLSAVFVEALRADNTADCLYTLCVALNNYLPTEQVCIMETVAADARLLALSSSPDFDSRSTLVQQILALSNLFEEKEPHRLIAIPDASSEVPNAQQSAWMVLPLQHGQWRGALLIALAPDCALNPEQKNALEQLAPAMANLIALQRSALYDLPDMLRQVARRLNPLQARRAGQRWPFYLTAALCLLLLLGLWQSPYRVSAPVQIEALHQRSLVAPFAGFVASANKRAGEAVKEGELIATLDDRSLVLERQRWLSQIDEYRKQARQAMANREQAEARIISAQLAQAEAQLRLVEARLQRTELRAPIDGMIVEGDLSRAMDAPVNQGEVLFQIAPLDAYRAVFKVAEQDMALVAVGQPAALRLKAFPQDQWRLTLSDRALVYEQDANGAWYRAEALVVAQTERLRPGMEGQGKIEIGDRSLLWQGLRGFVNWWRMAFWRWWP